MAKTKDSITIISFSDNGEQIKIEAPARPLSLKLLSEVEKLRQQYTDFGQLAALVASMADAGFDETDEAMRQFKQLILLFDKGLTQEQAKEILRKNMSDTAIKNATLGIDLLRVVIDRSQLTTAQKELLDSDTESDFWQNADLTLLREQSEEYFRRYQ